MPPCDGLILSGGPGERLIALRNGDAIIGFVIDRGAVATGDLVIGRIGARPSGLDAAFVDIGDEQPGFLARPGSLREGAQALLQVTAPARRDKGAVLSARPSLSGHWLVYEPARRDLRLSRQITDPAIRERLSAILPSDAGLMVRSAAIAADDATLLAELDQLRSDWQTLTRRAASLRAPARLVAPTALERVLHDEPAVTELLVDQPWLLPEARRAFKAAEWRQDVWQESGAADALDAALGREVPTIGGGSLFIDEAAGATIIDIDGGGQTPEQANSSALPEIARQLRLRSLAGHILIDVIPMQGKTALAAWLAELGRYLDQDPTPTQIIGATRLGMVELTRERRQPSLAELFLAPPSAAHTSQSLAFAALRAVQTAALRPNSGLSLLVAPPVLRYLEGRPDLLAEIATHLGRSLSVTARPDIDAYEVITAP